MNLAPADYQMFNEDGRGFEIKGGVVTSYDYREIFLKNNDNFIGMHEKPPGPSAEISKSAEAQPNTSSLVGIKRKVDDKAKDEEFTEAAECSVKRIKRKSKHGNDSTEEEEISAEELLFSNDLVLQIIFSHLNLQDLKSCRQVNRIWYLEATKILLKRDCLASIQVSDSAVTFQDSIVYKRPIPLEDFRTIIANSKLFPCTGFCVSNDPLSPNVINFFREHGHFVKSFRFEPEYFKSKETKTTIVDILLLAAGYFPNLQILRLLGCLDVPTTPMMEMAIDIAPQMKNLHTLELEGDLPSNIVSLILSKACNLKNIYLLYDFDGDYDDFVDNMLKIRNFIPHLKNINLTFTVDSLRTYQQVLEQMPRLSKIEMLAPVIDFFPETSEDLAKMGRFLTAMLQHCSETVTEISHLRCLGHIPQLKIPAFPKVKRLQIDDSDLMGGPEGTSRNPLLPLGVSLTEIFPNVASLEFYVCSQFSNELKPEEILEAIKSPMFSVRHLSVISGNNYIPECYIEKLCALLPNVTSVTFPLFSKSSYEDIWKLSALQQLNVVIDTRTEIESPGALDSAFTGFSIDVVKKLRETDQVDLNMSDEEVAALRLKPSIVDLKDLRKLTLRLLDVGDQDSKKKAEIIFYPGNSNVLLEVKDRTILSYISKRFGFDLCPQLKSNVCVKFRQFTKLTI